MTRRLELQFLPAALEIEETPPHPAARLLAGAIGLFTAMAIGWASLARVDVVVVAHGKLVPSGRVKLIQPVATSVVKRIAVTEGEHVHAGQVLIELDGTEELAQLDRIERARRAHDLDRTRLRALLALADEAQEKVPPASAGGEGHDAEAEQPVSVTDLVRAEALPSASATALAPVAQRVQLQIAEYRAVLGSFASERFQKEAEGRAIDERIAQLDAVLPLVTERARALESLARRDVAPRVEWLTVEQERIESVKERDVQRSLRARNDAELQTLEERRQAYRAETLAGWRADLAEVEARLDSYVPELIEAEQHAALKWLRAPVAGVIERMEVHTVGGVVTPAQALMRVVPDVDALMVEARLLNKDVGFVSEGRSVALKFEAFPFTKYGTIPGEILEISKDAVSDERQGLVYSTQIRLARTGIDVDGRNVRFSSGMAVTAEIHIGTRRLIEFVLSPIIDHIRSSARER